MPLLCPCLPCCSHQDSELKRLSTSVSEGSYYDTTNPTSKHRKTIPIHKHGIQWQVHEILTRQCDTNDEKLRLLKFTGEILAGAESAVSKPGDWAFLQVILTALPSEEKRKDDCRNLISALEKDGVSMSILDSALDTPLLRAMKCGNRGAVDALLYTRCDINATDRYSSTCLIYAAQHDERETVKTILQQFSKTVNLDKTDYANYTALAYAACGNNFQLCSLLLNAGARPDVNSTSPLFLAVSNNASDALIQLLISHGASVNVSNSDGLTALAAAAKTRRPNIVFLLIESGANYSANWYKNPAFNIALNMDHLEILKIFIDRGVDILCSNPKGFSVVHEACCQGSVQFLSHVISTTAVNLDARNRQRQTAAHLAAQYGHSSCLEVLFHAGTDCWSLDPRGQTALELSLFHNRSGCVMFFVDNPVFPRQRLFSTMHVLHNDYDQEALARKPAVGLFTSRMIVEWGEGQQVDTLFQMCVISIRRYLGQKPASRVTKLPLPEKVRDNIVGFR
ncbi:serine/threonine-protein phosphatase 6 regulatory ankyrin repeat subunit C-like [Littorina saxatilis]|uniref:SOCS box domain-containing protein n=1 Tax=Littorina saxatilis TaxID=31220 RepID=A0AAN9GJK5_9CAEN